MKFFRQFKWLIAVCVVAPMCAAAVERFQIKRIRVQGLHHIKRATVMHYLPVRIGQHMDDEKSNQILAALYRTGFFSQVSVDRQGGTLIVHVDERPVIGQIKFVGNTDVKGEQLKKIREQYGLKLGEIYDAAKLQEVVQGLKAIYINKGYLGTTVTKDINRRDDNRLDITMRVNKGQVAIIQAIHIVGNHAFSRHTLLGLMSSSTPNLLSFFTEDDHYAKEKLSADVDKLRGYYLNHGYLRFEVLSKDVTVAPDKAGVTITLHLSEGSPYKVNAIVLPTIGVTAAQRKHIHALLADMLHEPFSKKAVVAHNAMVSDYLGDLGYAYPTVSAVPQIDDIHHTAKLIYTLRRGRKYYVRHITIIGNSRTKDSVIRRSMRQMEGGLYSSTQTSESKRLLANLPYLRNIQITKHPVKGSSNQIDMTVHVKDVSAGKASIMGGYSDVEGFLYGASASEQNFLGTGNFLSLAFQRSQFASNYSVSYENPFYTTYGVSRGFDMGYTKTTPGKVNLSTYTQDAFNFDVNFGVPVSEYDRFTFGLGYLYSHIRTNPLDTPWSIQNYIKDHGNTYHEAIFRAGLSHSNYDRAVFPTKGFGDSLGLSVTAPMDGNSLSYYKSSYHASLYYPLEPKHRFVLNLHTTLGYGNGFVNKHGLPFFEHFYAGGISTVPGYTRNTLGPRALGPALAKDTALGGSAKVVFGANVIFPNYISESLRTSLTFNGGNVYADKIRWKELRYSAGLLITWYSPVGALDFSFAKALNAKSTDDTSFFQFSMGASL